MPSLGQFWEFSEVICDKCLAHCGTCNRTASPSSNRWPKGQVHPHEYVSVVLRACQAATPTAHFPYCFTHPVPGAKIPLESQDSSLQPGSGWGVGVGGRGLRLHGDTTWGLRKKGVTNLPTCPPPGELGPSREPPSRGWVSTFGFPLAGPGRRAAPQLKKFSVPSCWGLGSLVTLSLVLTSPCRPLELAAVWKGNAAEGEGESAGQAPWGPMTGRQKDLHWVLSLFLVLRMVETVSGARGPFTGTHMSSPFSASDVKQTPTVDVYIQVGSWHQAGVYSPNQRIFVARLCYVAGTQLN